MKRIIFVIDSLRIGGIQTALMNILRLIDYTKYEIYLLAFYIEESYKKQIPKEVKVMNSNEILSIINIPSKEVLKLGRIKYIIRKLLALLCRVFSANTMYTILYKTINLENMEFDVAISFTNNGDNKSVYFGCNKFVLEKVYARKKITWLHVDYKELNMNTARNNYEYNLFDKIICVSKSVEETFLKYIPNLRGKTEVIYNMLDIKELKRKANIMCEFAWKDGIRIVTVARLDYNKNVKESLAIAKILKRRGHKFHWVFLGDGPELGRLMKLIDSYEINEEVSLLGYIDNPYPFIKTADLYVSTSLTESFGLSIYESLILSTPAIVKNYPAAKEIVIDGVNGFIVDGDEECMAERIINVMEDKELYQSIKDCKIDYYEDTKINMEKINEQF